MYTNASFIRKNTTTNNQNCNDNKPYITKKDNVIIVNKWLSNNQRTDAQTSNQTKSQTNSQSNTSQIKRKRKGVNGKVNALRTPDQIQAVKDYFLNYDNTVKTRNNSYGIRNYCIVIFGLNTALRASDILMFTIGEVIDEDGNIRDKVTIKEQKTGKKRNVYFNDAVKEALEMYLDTLEDYNPDDFLFPSNKRKWDEEKQMYIKQPISVRSFWQIMNKCSKDLELDKQGLNIGTHTLRKTWARNTIINNREDSLIKLKVSEALNHSSEKMTYTYADITADEQRELFMNNQL